MINTKKLTLGIFLLASFGVVLFIIFMPIFGNGRNGLQFSDDFFNSLAKGSSNYMNEMRELAHSVEGTPFTVDIKMDTPDQAQKVEKLFTHAGAQVQVTGAQLKISGGLGKVLGQAVNDADLMFNQQREKLQETYGFAGREAVKLWWTSLKKVADALTKQKAFKQARVINEVQERALEPGFNFYGITPTKVSDNIALLTFMLVFYVIYTLWFGYGIFELFEGFGLGTGKSVAKKEV
jgi:hypothetical protein